MCVTARTHIVVKLNKLSHVRSSMVVIWLLLKSLQDTKDESETYIIAQDSFLLSKSLLSVPLSIIVPLFSCWSSIWKSSGVILVNQTECVCVCVYQIGAGNGAVKA